MIDPESEASSKPRTRTLTWDQWIQQHQIEPEVLFNKLWRSLSRIHSPERAAHIINLLKAWQDSGESIATTVKTLSVGRSAIESARRTALRVMAEPDDIHQRILIHPTEKTDGDPITYAERLKDNYKLLTEQGLDLDSILFIIRGLDDTESHDAQLIVQLQDKNITFSVDRLIMAEKALGRVFRYINDLYNADIIQSKPTSTGDTDILIP